jgi:ABC-2 type transport system permease protein
MALRPRNVLRLGLKELRGLRSDPVLVVLIVYIFTLAVYSVATGVRLEVRDGAVAVVDEDRSALSRSIAAAILPPHFRPAVRIEPPDIAPLLDSGRLVFVLEIPPRFEADLLAGRGGSVLLNVDATAMAQAGNGAFYLREIVDRAVADRLGRSALPVDLVVRARFNPNLKPEWFGAVMQVINAITILSIILPGAALLREREHGTLEHLVSMPVTAAEILLAKIWPNALVIVAAAQFSLLGVVHGLIGAPLRGSLLLFAAGTALYQASLAALGILLATLATSTAQFGLLAIPVLMVLSLLSGATTPFESMPRWLQEAVVVSPTRHFVDFAQAVLYRGAGIGLVAHPLAALAALGGAFLAISLAWFRASLFRST